MQTEWKILLGILATLLPWVFMQFVAVTVGSVGQHAAVTVE
jgi:hypothetical protein